MATVIYFLRHANAEETDRTIEELLEQLDWQADWERNLTSKGMRQALLRGKRIGGSNFDLCLISPPNRCEQTAQQIIGRSAKVPMIKVPTLYLGPEGPNGKLAWKVFRELLYSPLSAYLKSEIRETIIQDGIENARIIKEIIAKQSPIPQRVLVVGHSITLQAIGQQFTPNTEIFKDSLGEVEGFRINMETGKAFSFGPLC